MLINVFHFPKPSNETPLSEDHVIGMNRRTVEFMTALDRQFYAPVNQQAQSEQVSAAPRQIVDDEPTEMSPDEGKDCWRNWSVKWCGDYVFEKLVCYVLLDELSDNDDYGNDPRRKYEDDKERMYE